MDEITVSIICIAYNHEKYIAKALDSFLMQETSFKYEIIVHDDASTDNTAAIIEEYANKHSNIIPIIQKENQYSKGVQIVDDVILPYVKGQFIAFCEGDDYWTDKEKLQIQYDALIRNSDADMCAHATFKDENGKNVGVVCPSELETILSPEEVIRGGGWFLMTNSLFYRRSLLDNKPEFRKVLNIDYSIQIQGALRGGIIYIPRTMSAYRLQSSLDAWTYKMKHNPQKKINHHRTVLKMLETLNKETEYKFESSINLKEKQIEFDVLWLQNDYKKMIAKSNKEVFKRCSLKKKCIIVIGSLLPKIANMILKKYRVC